MRRRPAARRQVRRATRVTGRTRRRMRRRRLVVGGAILVGGGALVHKLSKKDAQKIEQTTGVPPEEMSPEELDQTMQQLGIQSQPLTAEDQAALRQADASGQPAEEEMEEEGDEAPAPPQAAAPAQSGSIDELKQLADLHAQGILTDEEFAAKKKQILGI